MRSRTFPPAAAGLILTAGVLLSVGCATSRGTLDVRRDPGSNPAQGTAVKIAGVTDARDFQLRPSSPSIPSLKDGRIDDGRITSRAIARKRNGYGKAMGDIVLPEERTVQDVAVEALVRGLREGGFRVLEEGQPGYDDAVPLEAEIDQFWAWFTPGFWAAHIEFDARIRLTGPIEPFEDGREFKGYVRLGTQAATGGAWLNTINKGLDDLSRDMTSQLGGTPAGVGSR